MISIITPCNKIVPWQNARLINVCSQDFDDWEWIILDNSKDGCVKEYVERFFVEMQGVSFKHCKEKIKVYHDPLDGISVENGRYGIMRNKCIDLVSYDGDSDVIFTLDSDDFIYEGTLSKIQNAVNTYKDSEFFTGMRSWCISQNLVSGAFYNHNTEIGLSKMPDDTRPIEILDNMGFDGVGYSEYKDKYLKGEIKLKQIIYRNDTIRIPYSSLVLKSSFVTSDTDYSWSFLSSSSQPLAFKKKAFLEKIGGYCTSCACEDNVYYIMPHRFKNPVYIKQPLLMICSMIDDNNQFASATTNVVESTTEVGKVYDAVVAGNYLDRYNFTRDCMRVIKPIISEQ